MQEHKVKMLKLLLLLLLHEDFVKWMPSLCCLCKDTVTHDVVQKMQYLDMCFSEVLRINPPAGRCVLVSIQVCISLNSGVYLSQFRCLYVYSTSCWWHSWGCVWAWLNAWVSAYFPDRSLRMIEENSESHVCIFYDESEILMNRVDNVGRNQQMATDYFGSGTDPISNDNSKHFILWRF